MSFQQVYYTSCEKGLSPGEGFQVNAASPDVAPPTLQRVERLGSYTPPHSAPLRPTPEEIEQFPVSLFFQTLDDVGVVLGQAKYIGVMADGRYGNFFTHSLITTNPYADFFQTDQLLPIETWLSKCWVTTESNSTILPDLEKIPFGETINFSNVQIFLRDPARREMLPRYLSAVAEALKTNRRIIIIDGNENIALWIAAASYVLPYHLVLKLTFNTYVQNPYNTDSLITGTTEDSTFNFAPHEIEHLFSVFDTKGGRFTQLEPDGFALKSAFLYQQTYAEVMTGFAAFVEQVAPDMPVEELEDALSTYCYFEDQQLASVDDVRVLIWSSRYVATLADKDFTNLFSKITAKSPIEAEILHAATDFYLATLKSGINAPSIRQIEDLYLQWLISEASCKVDPTLLAETADKLPRRIYQSDAAEKIFKEWLRQLKDAGAPARFEARLRLGDKMGFVEQENDILTWLGKNVAGAWLADTAVQQVVRDVSGKSGGKSLLEGIGAFLVEQIDNLPLFASLSILISDAESYGVLSSYAVKTQNLPLYLRLIGMKANLTAGQADRVAVLNSHLAAIQTSFKTNITAEIMQTAFNSVWLNQAPTLSEANQLLSPPLIGYVITCEIPRYLINSLSFDDAKLTAQQIELITKLSSEEVYGSIDAKTRVAVNAFAMVVEFQLSPEGIDEQRTAEYLSWLTSNRADFPQLAPRLYQLLGRKFIKVQDLSLHSQALPEYMKESSGSFLESYQGAVLEVSRTRKSHSEIARLLRIWTLAARHNRGMETHLRNWIGVILENQSKKNLEKLEVALDDNTYRVWIRARQQIEQAQKGPLGKFFDNIFRRG
ncbi:MAG: hypothetical protein AABN95_02300 [Acidobacteriota bacterium]